MPLKFDIYNKKSNQITKIIEAEAIELVNIAIQENKRIAIEKLDTTKSKVSNRYGNEKAILQNEHVRFDELVSA